MTKSEEIKLLRRLGAGDSYFSQAFPIADIVQMCQNIENDFPILLGASINAKADECDLLSRDVDMFRRDLAEARSKADELNHNFVELAQRLKEMAQDAVASYCAERVFNPIEYLGFNDYLKIKLSLGLELNGVERDFLRSLL